MSFQAISPEQLAELFHHYHRALAPDFGCAGKPISPSWKEVPKQEKNRMVAAARLTLLELDPTHGSNDNVGRYFARAGEAEWGC